MGRYLAQLKALTQQLGEGPPSRAYFVLLLDPTSSEGHPGEGAPMHPSWVRYSGPFPSRERAQRAAAAHFRPLQVLDVQSVH